MDALVGKKVKEIRPMTDAELKEEGWDGCSESAPVLVFEDGTRIFPSRDNEGNGPGALFGKGSDGAGLHLLPK